jgi:hypothetical protein
LPHAPQFALSVVKLAQVVPHFVSRVGHSALHMPATQTWPAAHDAPHVPQWFTSFDVSTHAPPQFVLGRAHEQLPAVHIEPPLQVTPHPPQLVALDCVSMHAPPHAVVPGVHCAWH